MNIIKYDPFRELRGLHDEMSRLFSGVGPSMQGDEFARGAWSPNVDIYEDTDKMIVEAELPGMDREDFEVNVENNILTLKGERKFEKKDEQDNFHRVERSYGSFTRSFTLPPTVAADSADAIFENGLLRLTLAKREEAKPRRIEVKVGSEPQAKQIDTTAKKQGAGQ